jgi:integrase/recombinase XerD
MKLDSENGVVARFLLDCRVRVLSERTIALYRFALTRLVNLLDSLCGISDLEQVTVTHLRSCVNHLLTEPLPMLRGRYPKGGFMLAVSTVRCDVRIWKNFFNWCYQEELIDKNPVNRLKSPEPEKRVKATFTPDQLQAMLDSCDLRTEMGFRDYAVLSLMVDAGLRLSEIVGLTIEDVHLDYVKVYGKGRKEREVGLHPNVSKILWKYVEKYRHPIDKNERALFIGHGKPLVRFGIKDVVSRAKRRCGFDDLEITPHVFRHTFAKEYMDRSGDITSLSRELGHSDIKVTQVYLSDFSSYDARKKHKDRSVFNDIKVQKKKSQNKRQKD